MRDAGADGGGEDALAAHDVGAVQRPLVLAGLDEPGQVDDRVGAEHQVGQRLLGARHADVDGGPVGP